MTDYIMKRKLRHIQSLGLYNVAIPLSKTVHNSDIIFIKANSCFFTIETTRGHIIYISENKINVLRSIQFNDMKFEGSPINQFILNIFVEIPKEIIKIKGENDKWSMIASYIIDLDSMHRTDPEVISSMEMNVPVFKMKDGYFISEKFLSKNFLTDIHGNDMSSNDAIHLHDETPKFNSSSVKPSINFNSLLKLNKLIEYQKQINQDKNDISQKIEQNLVIHKDHNPAMTGRIRTIENYIKMTERMVAEKKMKIEFLKKEISKSEATFSAIDTPSSAVTAEQEEYGNIYSNLIQIRERMNRTRSKRIYKLLAIFKGIPFTNKDIKLFEYDMSNIETSPVEKLTFTNINHDSVLKIAQVSEENRININTQLGNYALLLSIISSKILNIRIPYNMSYYGSTSIIDLHYPLYLMDLQSVKHLNRFQKAISLLNININQMNYFLQV